MVMDEVCSDSPGGAKQQCTTEYTRACETVHYTEVCKDVPREVCVTPRNCQQVERKQCKKVSVQEAVPVAECSCEDVSETECTSSPVVVQPLCTDKMNILKVETV